MKSKKNIFIVANGRLIHTLQLIERTNWLQMLVFLLFFSFCGWNVGAQEENNLAPVLQSKMIWAGSDNITPGFTVFRKTIDLENIDMATFHVFADSKYILWINGTEVLRGPCRFDPVAPSFDSKEITSFLKQGKNAVVVMVMSHGSNGKMMDHTPGLAAGLEIKESSGRTRTVWTDTSWRWNNKTRFLPPVQNWGFVCDRIDARIDDGDWTQLEYDDSRWETAVSVDGNQWGKFTPRIIPLLAEKEMGWQSLNKDKLPAELIARQSYIIRANEMIQGFPKIKFEAEESVVIKFEMGYSGDSTQVGETYGASCSYTAKSGEQECVPTDSYGFRYLKISVLSGKTGVPFHVRLKEIDLIDRRYPYLETGSFECNDPFLNELWKRSALTMKVNCEDGYMDCALREKAEWMGDGAVVQYPLSRTIFAITDSAGIPRSDAGLITSMLRHIAQSQSDSGMFKAHHPSDRFDIHGYIEDYSCLWVQALRDVYEHTGNTNLVRELWEPLKKQMNWFEDNLTSHGLVYGREFTFVDNPLVYARCEGATLNAFVYKAFLDAAVLASVIGDSKAGKEFKNQAAEISKSFNKYLWIPGKQTYSSGLSGGKHMMPTSHAALLALNRGIVPENRKEQVKKYLFSHYNDRGKNVSQNGVIPDDFFDINLAVRGIDHPYTAFWMFEEMYKDGRDSEALEFMHKKWEQMMRDTVIGTLWEAFGGGDLCHNMGAVPAYFLSTKVLGVSEKLPVSSKVIEIRPQLGNLTRAEGTVVTVHGPVHVKWEKQNNGFSFSIEIPKGIQAEVYLPHHSSCKKLLVNNREMPFKIIDNNLFFKINSTFSAGYCVSE
jgi:hypothetical protein